MIFTPNFPFPMGGKTVTLSNGWKGPVTNGMYSKIYRPIATRKIED